MGTSVSPWPRANPCAAVSEGANPLLRTEFVNFTSYKNGRTAGAYTRALFDST